MLADHNDASRGEHPEERASDHITEDAARYSANISTVMPSPASNLHSRDAARSHLLYHSHTIAEVEAMAYEREARSHNQPTVKKVELSIFSQRVPDLLNSFQSTKRALSQNASDVSDSEATRSSPRSCLSHLRINSQPNSQTDQCPITAPSAAPHSPDEEEAETSVPTAIVPPSVPVVPVECVLTPSSTAVSSERAHSPLTFEMSPEQIKAMKNDYYEQGRIFTKTRYMMAHITNKLFVVSSRGYARAGWVPTKQTTPRLQTRRYSVDVNVKNWNHDDLDGWNWDDVMEVRTLSHDQGSSEDPIDEADRRTLEQDSNGSQPTPRGTNSYQAEPIIFSAQYMRLPNPCRYSGFNSSRLFWRAPRNEGMYLDLGEATIKNHAFLDIATTSFYNDHDPWMHGDSIDMALEILRRKTQCDRYSIDIANSNSAQVFYMAAQCNDGSTREFEQYRARFCNKRWIFIVINDGFGGDRYDTTTGSHWSLVAMNRRANIVHYYDSYYIHCRYRQNIASEVARGLLLILDENLMEWKFEIEYNSPDQDRDNQFQKDVGACGPFVYLMTSQLINHIELQQEHQRETECQLDLPDGFNEHFRRVFNSRLVRHQIQQDMVVQKCRIETPMIINKHDRCAVEGEDVVLSDELPPEFLVPRHQRAVRSSRYSRTSRTPSPDWNSVSGSEADDTTRADSDSGTEAVENIILDLPKPETIADTEAKPGQHEEHEGSIILIIPEDCDEAEGNVTMSDD